MAKIALGAFDLECCIGRGGMGQVWRGVHRRTDHPVAVKILDTETALRPGYTDAFRDEARVVASLDHPGIISVLELGVVPEAVVAATGGALVGESPYLVMEYAHHGTLESRLKEMAWSEVEAVLLALLDALAHAHARGVIHLDVKPTNLLLGCGSTAPSGLVDGLRLTDFGLSWQGRAPGRAERRAELGGTLGRMAPEQIQAAWREYGPWTDLYAVGAMVWQYATGKKPFAGTTRAAMLVGPLTRDLPDFAPIRSVPMGLDGWMRVMMARDAADRFPVAADARDALLALRTPGRRPPPRLPSWRATTSSSAILADVGLGLFGLRSVPFVGRSPERDVLWRALNSVSRTRRARAVLLRGPEGMGKSRLAEWVGQRAMEVGAAGAFLRADHSGGAPDPQEGLRPAIARYLGCVELDLPAAVKHLKRVLGRLAVEEDWMADSLARWLLPGEVAPGEPPGVLMTVLLRAMSRQRPVVLWLDDVQWGQAALDVIAHLLRYQDVEPTPLLVVMTASEVALSEQPDAEAVLSQLHDAGTLITVPVGPLQPPEDELLLQRMLPIDPTLIARVAEQADGNPLLAVHIVGDWISRGLLHPAPEGFRLDADEAPLLPESGARLPDRMRLLWQRRLWRLADSIPGPVMEAMELAALMGAEVRLAEWRALLGTFDPDALVDGLLRARLARLTPRGWAFVHGMIREVLTEQARRAGRWSAHHRACAGLLVAARTPELQERLGHHLLCAGEPRMAFAHLMSAARTLDHRGISRAASRVVARAGEAMEMLGAGEADRSRCACRLLTCQIEIRRHKPLRWIDELRGWRDVARREQWPELEAEALWVLGEACQKSDLLDEASACLEAAQVLADRLVLPRLEQELLSTRALQRLRVGDQLGAEPLLMQLLTMPVHPDAPTVQLSARLNLASIARISGRLDLARRYATEAVELGQAQGCLDVVSHGRLILGVLADREGDLVTSEAHITESLQIAQRTGKFRAIAIAWNSLGELARRQGELALAEDRYRTSLAWAEAGGRPMEPPQINLALVLIRRQRYAEARDLLRGVQQRAEDLKVPFIVWHCRAFLLSPLAGLREWTAFDAELTAILDDPLSSQRFGVDVAEEAERAGYIAHYSGQSERAASVWRFARAQWMGLGQAERAESLTGLLEEG
ncbi:MAG: serine/threonine protein kinase/tetratricopeptide (TPR) repeat protein [Myxococcota bacterium]|jgi:serine/threonine protein kinase/tetratricopeptide (TPR) repeat protein